MLVHSLLLLIVLSCCCSAGAQHDKPPAGMTMGAPQSPGQSDDGPTNPSSGPMLLELVEKDKADVLWRKNVLDLLTQLVLIQKEVASNQVQVVQLLGELRTQGSNHIQDLQNVARHQSLLVENHQALLLQTSRIASHLQDLTKKPAAADPPPTSIHLNSVYQPNQTERILNAGSSFSLSCHGNGSVHWSSTALRLQFTDTLSNPLQINDSLPKHTGTYHCGYSDQNQEHLATWVHLYIKDSHSMFVTPRKLFTVKEGQDFLFKCQLTDPSVKNLTLQLEDSTRGRILPEGMNVTFDRQRGALIQDVQRSFTGRYVCSGWKDGKQFISNSMELRVACRFCLPSLSVSLEEVIRLKGEKFEVTCMTRNPDHFYSITWTHPTLQTLDVSTTQPLLRKWVNINSTVTVSAVSMKHQGTYTCTAINGDGVARATTHLTVLDRPYLKIYLKPVQHVNANTRTSEADQFANVNISTESIDVSVNATDVNGASSANISGSSIVEAYKGQDVTLTFVIEAYPPVTKYDWMTHANISQVYEKHYISKGYRLEASLLLGRVHQEDRGQYSFHFSNSFFSGVQNVDLRIFRSPSAVVSLQNDTLTCSSSAYPPPTILWYSCPGVQDTCGDTSIYQVSSPDVTSEEEEEEVVSRYQPLSDSDGITIECVANNTLGGSRHVFQPREPQLFITPALIGALSTAAVLFLLLLVASYKWKQRPKYEIRWKIIESTDGNNYTFIDPSQLPYNQKWEFPRDKLRLGAVLGSGAFGKVVEATAYGLGTDNNVTRVAVKMLKPSAHSEERDALMSELKILSHLGYHDNIVNLLGACTQGGPMLMITEYCSHGDLLNFLRAHAQDFMTSILSVDEVVEEVFYKNMAAQNSRLRSDSGISCCSEYQEMLPVSSPGQIHQAVQMDSLSVGDLMRFSFQVAQGLDFLSNRNCIHRDVAARNVLLTDRRVAKICDFGLARDIRNDDSYIVQGNARLPVKWMAPESIFQCVYTVQSDVWSYGVLLWEIFSLGKSPYPNVAVDTNFYKMIKDGRHMAQPDFAPVEMYKLMTLCWSLEPTDRPTFKTIGQLINRLLPSAKDASPHHCHQAMYHNIDEFREEDEEEEVRGGAALKRGEEQTDIEEEEKEPMMKNIYQLS